MNTGRFFKLTSSLLTFHELIIIITCTIVAAFLILEPLLG
ncbi:hypothetical protein V462_12495 [Pantoea ananatis 15320]|nr:hypothetical protein V462_12495 [Pantoea ananatis 15320]